ncbi:MAG: preprotein translocase subunit YajC [Clostridia bacterium]|nr:preprotein translocase subunit YajC [Clostridia bacterium]MBQ8859648.1 preprotein translocase subunit YajC [Clostridia bacterium]
MFQFLLEGEAANNAGGSWFTWVSLILLIVVFYFLIIRPQRKQEKDAAAMRNALEVGDEITTIGGIIGEIVSMKDETITIETSKAGTKIRFLKSAVRSVDVSAASKRAPTPENTENK